MHRGQKEQIEGFLNSLKEHPPKRAAVLKINTENITADTTEQFEHFDIIESEKKKGKSFISPDIAICDECKEEMFDPKDDGICIRLSTAPAVDQGLRFWMLCRMTGNAQV